MMFSWFSWGLDKNLILKKLLNKYHGKKEEEEGTKSLIWKLENKNKYSTGYKIDILYFYLDFIFTLQINF